MIVKIKQFNIEMELKNKGMELEIRNTKGDFLGDMIINKTGIIWCKGKRGKDNGVQKNWEEIIALWNGSDLED